MLELSLRVAAERLTSVCYQKLEFKLGFKNCWLNTGGKFNSWWKLREQRNGFEIRAG